ncbi:hypothetical protein HDU88_005998 [Geranomyces variabilis]|nr:hypothetical protein HDU88_005998 [Geranomyces variabilis]
MMLRPTTSCILRSPTAATLSLSVRPRAMSTMRMPASAPMAQGGWGRALLSVAALGGTGLLLHQAFNTEPSASPSRSFSDVRPAGAMTSPASLLEGKGAAFSPAVRDHLHATYAHVAGSLGLTAVIVNALHRTGATYRLMRVNPLVFMGVSLVTSIGSMTVARNAEPGPLKYAAWGVFNASIAAGLAPLPLMYRPALLAKAGLYTLGLVGGISAVGLTAERDKYLYLAGPLMGGLGIVVAASVSQFLLARYAANSASRLAATAFSVSEKVSLYGGLAVFSGLVLYDTQKIVNRAESSIALGRALPPAVDEAAGLYLDTINLFVRMVTLLGRGDHRK